MHPESPADVIALADAVGSTSGILKAAQRAWTRTEFIVATDNGMMHKLRTLNPGKIFIEAPTAGNGATCKSCAHCPWMAMNGLAGLAHVLETGANEVHVDPALGLRARVPIDRMLAFTAALKNGPAGGQPGAGHRRGLMAPVSALIDFSSPGETGDAPRLRHAFGAPREILQARTAAEVRPLLDAVQAQARQGRWCVGYLRYEAAGAFDPALAVRDPDGPLAWFGVHDRPLPWPADEGDAAQPALAWEEALSRREFDLALAQLHEAIAAGQLYQVNYTSTLRGRLDGAAGADPHAAARALFAALQRAQPGGYAAFIDDGEEQVLSASPELFFDWRAGRAARAPHEGHGARAARPRRRTPRPPPGCAIRPRSAPRTS